MDVKWHEAKNHGMKTSHYEVWVGPHDGIEFVDKAASQQSNERLGALGHNRMDPCLLSAS